ncbi:Cullin-3 [Apophysomyces ossiformis]|uniref:Small ribosomal subunit protein uS3m n=1 Tax=Apophysomyces ossiformis TaxID=679940 RepID=A0A8H7BYS8_9FUNG|nr:Cullin-3 [Apophysomyces ossiformis]
MSFRKFTIKPPKRPSNVDREQEFQEGFQLLSRAIKEIFRKNSKTLSYEELYRTTFNLTIHGFGQELYHGVKDVIGEYLEGIAEGIIVPAFVNTSAAGESAGSGADSGASFLKTIKSVWDDFTTAMGMIETVLYYLDEKLLRYKLPRVFHMGRDLFRDKIVRSEKYTIQSQLISAMLNQIQLERQGDLIDRSAIKSAVTMLAELTDPPSGETVYVIDFEKSFLEKSNVFYQLESQKLTTAYDASEFMRKVEKRLEEEYERTTHCLSSITEPKIRKVVETQLIANNVATVIENMLNANKYGDLSRMYSLFSRVPAGLNEMKMAISKDILQLGEQINKNINADLASTPAKPKGADKGVSGGTQTAIRWVEEVLTLQEKFDKILDTAANKDKAFQTAFNEAFEEFINENPKSAEFISLFIDENLKKGLKGKSEDEVDDVLAKTITLFRFLRDKDVFERYYKQHLAKRLLFNRSVSDDAERGMLAKLKRECGYQFTNKLEGMFNDIRLSSEMNGIFKEYLEKTALKSSMDLSVTVLTSTFWPMNLSSSPKCSMPQSTLRACQSFEHFYYARHSGRRLTWQLQMGTADIRAQFDKGKHMLNVSTYAMMVLLLFNDVEDKDCLTFEDIQAMTNIPDQDLKRTLQSLACGKYRVLGRDVKGKDVNPGDKFYFNKGFTSNMARIKIQTVASKVESEGERKYTESKVDEERKHQIEAAIVRIMKDRRLMEHNLLIAEVTKQLSSRFMPNPIMVKKRIEALIDREYLERSAEDSLTLKKFRGSEIVTCQTKWNVALVVLVTFTQRTMSKSITALSLKGKKAWNTSIYSFSRNVRNNLLWEKDGAAKEALKHYFQHHLTSTPAFLHSPSRITIQMYYYADPNFSNLADYKLEPLEKLLTSLYPNKHVDMRLIRVHYPYMNAEILAQYLTINANRSSWSILTRKFMKGVPMVKPPLPHDMPFAVQWNSLLPHVNNGQLTSAIQGVKYQVSGRLGRRKGASRTQVMRKSLGTFQFTSHKSLVDAGRHTFANKNGSITVKVWIASALFGVNALAKNAAKAKPAQIASKM